MREILFRAKAINRDPNREYRTEYENGDWVYGLLSREKFTYGGFTTPAQMINTDGISGIDVEMDTLGQYTGLTDKWGRKIFEGDILKWDEKEWGCPYCEVAKWDYELLNMRKNDWEQWCEVIGNIYDNPELIKEEK